GEAGSTGSACMRRSSTSNSARTSSGTSLDPMRSLGTRGSLLLMEASSTWRLGGRRMVMHVRLLAVLGLLLLLTVIMAVGQGVVVMLVRVPVRAVLPHVERIIRMVV